MNAKDLKLAMIAAEVSRLPADEMITMIYRMGGDAAARLRAAVHSCDGMIQAHLDAAPRAGA